MAGKKKTFTTPTDAFITSVEDERLKDANIDSFKVPVGYRLVRESKSQRIQLLVTPSTATDLKTAAEVQGISLNELCNRIFEDYLKRG